MPPKALFRLAPLLLAAAALQGCSGDGSDKSFGETIQLTTRTVDPKPWISASRQGNVGYIPVGVTPPDRPTPAKTPDQLAAAISELDQERATAIAQAGKADPRYNEDQKQLLAEQRRRLAKAGLLDKAKLPDPDALVKEGQKSRAFARRPLPGAPDAVPAVQPASWPVPEHRRIKLRGVDGVDKAGTDCPPEETTAATGQKDCKTAAP